MSNNHQPYRGHPLPAPTEHTHPSYSSSSSDHNQHFYRQPLEHSSPFSSQSSSSYAPSLLPGSDGALNILKSCGLEPTDLSLLAELPEDALTLDSLPHLLKQIKVRRRGDQIFTTPPAPPFSSSSSSHPPRSSSRQMTITSPTSSATSGEWDKLRTQPIQYPLDHVLPTAAKSRPLPHEQVQDWQDRWGNPRRSSSSASSSGYGVDYAHNVRPAVGLYGRVGPSSAASGESTKKPPSLFSLNVEEYRPKASYSRVPPPASISPQPEVVDYRKPAPQSKEYMSQPPLQVSPYIGQPSLSQKQPPRKVALDFHGTPPMTYPYTCSLCEITVLSEKYWNHHVNSTRHADGQLTVLQQFPAWDCRLDNTRSSDNEQSQRSKNHEERARAAQRIHPNKNREPKFNATWQENKYSIMQMQSFEKKKTQSKRLTGGRQKGARPKPDDLCDNCGGLGHWKLSCPDLRQGPGRCPSNSTATEGFWQRPANGKVISAKFAVQSVDETYLRSLVETFGKVVKIILFPTLAFVEMGTSDQARDLVKFYGSNPISAGGQKIIFDHSATFNFLQSSRVVSFSPGPSGEDNISDLISIIKRFGPPLYTLRLPSMASVEMKFAPDAQKLVDYYSTNILKIDGVAIKVFFSGEYNTLMRVPKAKKYDETESSVRKRSRTRSPRRAGRTRSRSPSPKRRSRDKEDGGKRTDRETVSSERKTEVDKDRDGEKESNITDKPQSETAADKPVLSGPSQPETNQNDGHQEDQVSEEDSDIEGMEVLGEDGDFVDDSDDEREEGAENAEMEEVPEQSTGASTEPVESTGTSTEPLESTGTSTEPVESTAASSEPVESTGASSKPVESTGASTEPVGSTGASTEPVESTGASTEPVESTGASTEPVESTGASTEPVESTGASTEPVEVSEAQSDQQEIPEEGMEVESEPDFPTDLSSCITLDELGEETEEEAEKCGEKDEEQCTKVLFFKNLPYRGRFSDDEFLSIVKDYGKVYRYNLRRGQKLGFIEMDNVFDAVRAATVLSSKTLEFKGSVVLVQLSDRYKTLTAGWELESNSDEENGDTDRSFRSSSSRRLISRKMTERGEDNRRKETGVEEEKIKETEEDNREKGESEEEMNKTGEEIKETQQEETTEEIKNKQKRRVKMTKQRQRRQRNKIKKEQEANIAEANRKETEEENGESEEEINKTGEETDQKENSMETGEEKSNKTGGEEKTKESGGEEKTKESGGEEKTKESGEDDNREEVKVTEQEENRMGTGVEKKTNETEGRKRGGERRSRRLRAGRSETEEEKTNETVEEKTNETVEEKTNETVEEKTNETVEEKTNETVEEKTNETVEEKTNETVEEKTNETVEEKTNETVEEKTKETGEEENTNETGGQMKTEEDYIMDTGETMQEEKPATSEEVASSEPGSECPRANHKENPEAEVTAAADPIQPTKPVGTEFVRPVVGYFCNLCQVIYADEDEAKSKHCSTLQHYNKYQEHTGRDPWTS